MSLPHTHRPAEWDAARQRRVLAASPKIGNENAVLGALAEVLCDESIKTPSPTLAASPDTTSAPGPGKVARRRRGPQKGLRIAKSGKLALREADVLRQIMDYCEVEGLNPIRINSGEAKGLIALLEDAASWSDRIYDVIRDLKDAGYRDHPIRLAPAGTADVLVQIPAGRLFWWGKAAIYVTCAFAVPCWLELKSDSGRTRADQRDFGRRMDSIGALHAVLTAESAWDDVRRIIPPKISGRTG